MRTVFITGCSSGIGYLTAITFAKKGYQTFAGVRSLQSDGAKNLEQRAKTENLPLQIVQLDVTNEQSTNAAVETIFSQTHQIDVLINNAGFGYLGPVETFSIQEIQNQYDTNIFGALRLIQLIAPKMRENQTGHIINISSINGVMSFPLYGVYSSSKFALETLSEVLDFELSHFNIKVSVVEPGAFFTNFTQNRKISSKSEESGSVYAPLLNNFQQRYEKKFGKPYGILGKLMDPQTVADLLINIVESPKPRLRYLVGIDAHLYRIIRKILPYSSWKQLIKRLYNW